MSISVFIYFILALLASPWAWAAARAPPTPNPTYTLVIIGDSLSDNGNTFSAAGVPDSRYYWHGRFTDGPNWVDHLKGSINEKYSVQIFNYAYGSATACQDTTVEASYPFVKNMTRQIVDFVADVTSGKIPTGNNVKLVPVQWIGSYDVLQALRKVQQTGTMPTESDMAALVRSLITCRITGAAALASIPGVKDVVLVPISPVHTSPAVPAAMKPMIKQLGFVIAQQMAVAVADLQSKLNAAKLGVTVHLLGDFTWIERGMQTIRPPFKDPNTSCFPDAVSSLVKIPQNYTICKNPTEHLFYDFAHPETRFHGWFALKGFLPRMRQLRLLP